MKRLIIAEKPSLMRTIMKALETRGERFKASSDKEFYESENYVATSQFGHLLELKMPEEYEEHKGGAWSLDALPFFPSRYGYNIKKDAKKRYSTIGKLLKRSDIGLIVHCGDPDREGQILVDLVLREHKNTKAVIRPQLKALTDKAILEAFDNAKTNNQYTNLFNEGMSRMCFDWDFGINLSQYATLKTNARPALNVGRVIGAICTEIYRRDIEIENFVPEEFYKVVSKIEDGFTLTSKKTFPKDDLEEAEEWARALQSKDTVVTGIEKKQVTKKRPKLFSQTTLQAAMSKLFNYKPDKTLSLAQSLYEKGLITYPRTNTEYIAEKEKAQVESIVDGLNKKGNLAFRGDKSVFNDSKIEGHSAIIVTGKKPSGLSDDEMNCYKTVLFRFMATFCKEECVYDKTTVVLDNPLEQFKVSGETPVSFGWQALDPIAKNKLKSKPEEDEENQKIPKVKEGDVVKTDFKPVSAQTKPPAHYSVESLGKWMENPFRKEDSDDEEDYKNVLAGLQIGTEATRAQILSKAEEKGYIALKKKTYTIQPRGRFLVEACADLGIDFSKEMTASMGKALKDVGKGDMGIMDILNENRRQISSIISANKEARKDSASSGGGGEYVKKEKIAPSVYEPTGEEISFNKEWGGHVFSDEEQKALLRGETIEFKATSSKGNEYTAKGSLKKQRYKGKSFWGFALHQRELPEIWCGHTFTDAETEELLAGNKIFAEDFVSKAGKTFSCELRWKNGKFTPKFEKGGKSK